ncbi:DUF397 domain-containing protein [Yinghuangia sp. ASG 101]|uniref:DUF397 domain-containing protein n=1 Tax=Yinghuangia sp. ASG 101 TaxID=2896848 RepID=UPI001E43831C|nr:DUF397 domain-containing protein [Yinghuangia sp. ASG 101]UGQ13358.1 DUF397 domain-containing protein [Yinghuangia sp. ASG 101]
MTRTTPGAWRKSSYSNDDGGACVEVARGCPDFVPVRDSKDVARGHFVVPASSWSVLTASVKKA